MGQYRISVVTFICTYLGSLIASAARDKAKEKKTFLDGFKRQENHAMAIILALIAAGSTHL